MSFTAIFNHPIPAFFHICPFVFLREICLLCANPTIGRETKSSGMSRRLKYLFFLLFAGWVCVGAVGAVSETDAPTNLLSTMFDNSSSSDSELVSSLPLSSQLQALPVARGLTFSFVRYDSPQKEPLSLRFSVSIQAYTQLERQKAFRLQRSGYAAIAAANGSGRAFYRLFGLQV